MRSTIYLVLLLLIASFCSCRKQMPPSPYADLLSFTIKDAKGAPLQGAVQGNDIIVYWPPEQAAPDSIAPQLTVSDKAIVHPVSNTRVPFANGTTFSVTAEDGTSKVYHLKKVLNQPKAYIKDNGDNYGLDLVKGKFYTVTSGELTFTGGYLNTAAGQLKVFLQSVNGKEIEIPIDADNFYQNLSHFKGIPGANTIGSYTGFRIESVPYSISIRKDFEILPDPRPNHQPLTANVTLKIGDEFTLPGQHLDLTTGVSLWNKELKGYYDVDIVEQEPGKITIRIPTSDFPAGIYNIIYYDYDSNPDYLPSLNGLPGINRPLGAEIKVVE